jgi:diguanylate cyclase
MSNSSGTNEELERWKDKYFEQSDSFEEQKKQASDYAALLQRILVRVSLAAENVSQNLDQELASLRTAIRTATPEQNDLEERLKRIDKLILAADESKQQNAGKLVKTLDQLIEQLLALSLPRKQKNALKKLSKTLSKQALNLQSYPGILSEYASLQAEVIRDVAKSDQKGQGLFSRLLGGTKSQPVDALNVESDPESSSDRELELELETTEEESNESEELVPGFGSVARHIRTTLSNLLDQLSFPESAFRDVAKLRNQIQDELVWYELGPTLDDVANLVLSVVGKGQREFENFLKELDERLGKVQGFLIESRAVDAKWKTKNQEFDRAVRMQVDEISQKMDASSSLDELKDSISKHLDSIYTVVDKHDGDAKQFEQDKEAEVQALREKIEAMEQEAAYIRKRLKEERGKALSDTLTKLPNREAYDERFELELERWKRYQKPASLVVADIDHFKKINDSYGHLSGDKVLQIIAKELRKSLRKTDFVARYGGEEFVMLLPETNLETAIKVVDKVREMIGKLPFHFRDENIQITMSFGLIEFKDGLANEDGDARDIEPSVLFDRADEALYKAKKNGRNRLESWPIASD